MCNTIFFQLYLIHHASNLQIFFGILKFGSKQDPEELKNVTVSVRQLLYQVVCIMRISVSGCSWSWQCYLRLRKWQVCAAFAGRCPLHLQIVPRNAGFLCTSLTAKICSKHISKCNSWSVGKSSANPHEAGNKKSINANHCFQIISTYSLLHRYYISRTK